MKGKHLSRFQSETSHFFIFLKCETGLINIALKIHLARSLKKFNNMNESELLKTVKISAYYVIN